MKRIERALSHWAMGGEVRGQAVRHDQAAGGQRRSTTLARAEGGVGSGMNSSPRAAVGACAGGRARDGVW